MAVSVNDFELETECVYKNEHYSVRDNGAVLRHACKGKRPRPTDNQWTFGKQNAKNGYMYIASTPVHRIVATAFHNEAPGKDYVVDHRDTNRRNNRPENLLWVARLDNILSNPITVRKIIFRCGSVEAFLQDPSILRSHEDADKNFKWMRAVNPEEARSSWERLSKWAKKESNTPLADASLGEWLFGNNHDSFPVQEPEEQTASLTPNAVQRGWKTPSEFPCCLQEGTDHPIAAYAVNLKAGEIFSRNNLSQSVISDFATSEDGNTLWVLCRDSNENAIKPWKLARVTFENDVFVHTNLGSFFEKAGAEKQFSLVQGLEWTEEDSIDDYY